MKGNLKLHYSLFLVLYSLFFSSCSIEKKINHAAQKLVLKNEVLKTAHVGISVYDPTDGKYLYNHNGDKYFVPASNTKIPTCYAAMKYLGDSLVGLRVFNNDGNYYLFPSGDPTLLNNEFRHQPVLDFLCSLGKINITIVDTVWRDESLGSGWSWNDYNDDYMAERSSLPVYGNLAVFGGKADGFYSIPAFSFSYQSEGHLYLSDVNRELGTNRFSFQFNGEKSKTIRIPFATLKGRTNEKLLADTLKIKFSPVSDFIPVLSGDPRVRVIHSQPTDSLLKPMMHRSDNFFAEQSLLMVSNERLGLMNDAQIIDTLLKTDFSDLPQRPRWVDGSGLSRYNLFSPQDLVTILHKMKTEFGMQRLKEILPTGGEGTLSNYYKTDSGFVYAKTGTLSGVVALSGYLYTRKGKLLIFSTLVNNHTGSATPVRRAIEQFIRQLREKY